MDAISHSVMFVYMIKYELFPTHGELQLHSLFAFHNYIKWWNVDIC
jgi:hypothetical protein